MQGEGGEGRTTEVEGGGDDGMAVGEEDAETTCGAEENSERNGGHQNAVV